MNPSDVLRLVKEARAIFKEIRVEAAFNTHGGGKRGAGERRWAEWKRRATLARDKLDRAIVLAEAAEKSRLGTDPLGRALFDWAESDAAKRKVRTKTQEKP